MEMPELTMEDIVTVINSCKGDFLLVILLGEEDDNVKKESVQA